MINYLLKIKRKNFTFIDVLFSTIFISTAFISNSMTLVSEKYIDIIEV